jgi:glyoxylase-like metal-dependent hydrolase (beta-lactamase superfamily II)
LTVSVCIGYDVSSTEDVYNMEELSVSMNLEDQCVTRYEYRILQIGTLPLNPEAEYDPSIEHRCTSVLIWPEGAEPNHRNSVLCDPCFTAGGYDKALKHLEKLGFSFQRVGWIFVTHPHRDHRSNLADFMGQQPGNSFIQNGRTHLESFASILLPGHASTQKGLFFRTANGHMICVCGDAILDETWLRAWKYYWPNFYDESEIVQTWRSVALVLAHADVVIPGHGVPFQVTSELLEHLIRTFKQAEHAGQCPDVLETLTQRRGQLIAMA